MAYLDRAYPSPSSRAHPGAHLPVHRSFGAAPHASPAAPPVLQFAYLDLHNTWIAGATYSAWLSGMAYSPDQAAKLHICDPWYRLHARSLKDLLVGPFAERARCVAFGSVKDLSDTRIKHGFEHAGWETQMHRRSPSGREKAVDMDLGVTMIDDVLVSADPATTKEVTLVSGDRDMCPAVEKLRQRGIEVDVASFEHVLADDLRALARKVIRLEDYFDVLALRTSARSHA